MSQHMSVWAEILNSLFEVLTTAVRIENASATFFLFLSILIARSLN